MSGLQETGRGRSTRRPKPRPDHDSLPHNECPEPNCGTRRPVGSVEAFKLEVQPLGGVVWFCSWGCLGRYAAVQELRA